MKKAVYLVLLSLLGFHSGFGQSNITPDLVKAKTFADEVYANCMLSAGPNYITKYAEYLTRVEIITETPTVGETYALLSTVPLRNKCNQALTRDENNFNPSTFNPLKYFFYFYSTTEKRYRVNNSNYVIVIHPKP